MKVVYVLITSAVYDFEPCIAVEVFETLGAAQEEMEGLIQSFLLDENDMDWSCIYHDNVSCLYQEEGDYSRNHIEWQIYEREIIKDKEL